MHVNTRAPLDQNRRAVLAALDYTDLTKLVALEADPATGRLLVSDLGTIGSGIWTTFHLVSANTTNATNLKNAPGAVGGWYIYNSNTSARKVAFHNLATTPTAGANVFMSVMIPGGSAANVEFERGITFDTGIGISTVTGIADSDATSVAVNDLIVNIFYK